MDSWLESVGGALAGCSACCVEPFEVALLFAGVAFALLALDKLEEESAALGAAG